MRVDGGCHCGAITYEAELDPDKVGLCHCTDCQALTGTAFALFVPIAKADFNLKGQPKVYVKTAESGNRRAQAFCPQCGSRLYAAAETDPQVFNLRIGTTRQRAQLRPKVQVWCQSAMPWVMELGAVKQLPRNPPPA